MRKNKDAASPPDPAASDKAKPAGRNGQTRLLRQARILEIARQRFLSSGYDGASMSEIAADLGGSKATLWTYFSSKEALFAAVVDNMTAAYRDRIDELIDGSGDLTDTLVRFAYGFVETLVSPDQLALHRLVHVESKRFPAVASRFYERGLNAVFPVLANRFEIALRAELLRHADATDAAKTLVGLCMTDLHWRCLLGVGAPATKDDIRTAAEGAVSKFLRLYEVQN